MGGWDEPDFLSSVEILDEGANQWRDGPMLPYGIDSANVVEDRNGGVVLVGGESASSQNLDVLHQLPHGGADAEWIELKQKLKMGRQEHVAFLVPSDLTDCV